MGSAKFPVLHTSSVPGGLNKIKVPAVTPKRLVKLLAEAKNGSISDGARDFDAGWKASSLSETLELFDPNDFGKTFEIVWHKPLARWLRNYLITSCPNDGSKGSVVAFVAWAIVNGYDYHAGTQQYFTPVPKGGVIQLGIYNAHKNIFFHADDIEFRGYNHMLTFREVK